MTSFKSVSNASLASQTYFISDLHLEEGEPGITATFTHFLNERAPHADALYILGDFFETWIGDDDHTPFNTQIIAALKQLTGQGVPVYFMHGNRDFLIGKGFAKKSGVALLKDPTLITLYGERVLLMHGDSLCTLDKRHQRYRKYALNPWLQRLFLLMPLRLRRAIANQLRQKSQSHHNDATKSIMDVTQDAVEKAMLRHQTNLLIHGHTHRPAIHRFQLNQEKAERVVLSAWHDEIKILTYRSDGSYELESLARAD